MLKDKRSEVIASMTARLLIALLGLTCLHVLGMPLEKSNEKQEVDIETNENDEMITKMYAKEIQDGDNAEEPLEMKTKHHKAHKKYLHGHNIHVGHHGPIGLPINDLYSHGDPHHFGHGHLGHGGLGHAGLGHHDLGQVVHVHGGHGGHLGHGGHMGHGGHIGYGGYIGEHLPGHGPALPIKFPHEPHHHNVLHHGGHFGYHHDHMPFMPYPVPMCIMEKDDDDKKKDDKKKEKGKKSKRQLVPCHYYGPPSAGWGAFQPGWTGAGWGAPFWY